MNLPKLAPYLALALPLLTACDPDSQSLGNEPTETASGSGSGGDPGDAPSSAEAALAGRLEGGAIQHVAVRADGTVVAGGISGFLGLFGDLAEYENSWVGVFDVDGTLLWEQVLPKPVGEFDERQEIELTDVAAAGDGAVFATTIDYSADDNVIAKYAADGSPLWTTPLPARPRAVAATDDGGAIVVGFELAADDPNAIHGWAGRTDDQGTLVVSRTWTNDAGRNSSLLAVAVSADGIALGGNWGTAPASSQAEPWLLWVDDAFQTVAEAELTASGGTDRVRSLRIDDDGNAVASVDMDDDAIITVSPTGDVLSTVLVDPDVVMWSPYSSTGFLGGDRNNCVEQIGGGDCGQAAFSGFDAGERLWDVPIEGCNAITGHAVDAFESIVSVGCSNVVDGDVVMEGQLHRITAE